jgi:hypothetical protein
VQATNGLFVGRNDVGTNRLQHRIVRHQQPFVVSDDPHWRLRGVTDQYFNNLLKVEIILQTFKKG